MKRRLFVASSVALAASGCARATNALNEAQPVRAILRSAETLDRAVIGTRGLAKSYRESDIDADFPTNGLATPSTAEYGALVRSGYAAFHLPVAGLVERPQTFDYRTLRALANATQITRHDCVEGWSVVGKWRGVQLATLLGLVRPQPRARYVVFYSYDSDDTGAPFYGSIDLVAAAHPQTIVALDLNNRRIDPDHGGPARLRIPTQLAYKSTKWLKRIELVDSFAHIDGGRGGYWEDRGYEWYAGI